MSRRESQKDIIKLRPLTFNISIIELSSSIVIPLQISPKPLSMFFLIVLIDLILNLQIHLSISLRIPTTTALTAEAAIPEQSSNETHDILSTYGFPRSLRSLVPNSIKYYSLSDDRDFQIFLQCSCYMQFDPLVYYDEVVKGELKYGSVTEVSGIQAKTLFVWVTMTGIDADLESDMLEFYAGVLSLKLPAMQFQEIPTS